MRLGYKHKKENIIANKYWNNTVLPLLDSGSLEHAINHTYAYPNRVGLYPGLNCQFFCTFCGRNYNAKYNKNIADKSLDVFKSVIDQDPCTDKNWKDRFRISGGLEPLTNPYIGEIIRYGNAKGFYMQMYTNGFALTERFLEKQTGLFDLEVMRVSLYGHDQSSYALVTKHGKAYDNVIKNIKGFLKKLDETKSKLKLGVNWIILPGHSKDLYKIFDMIKDINGETDAKIQFITLREDFSQSNNYVSDIERKEMHQIFLDVEKQCSDIHVDYGYALHSVRHGIPTGPIKMAMANQLDGYGFPQVATSVDSLGSLYVYHESGFLERPGSERYIIGNVNDDYINQIVKMHLSGSKIKVMPFDVGFLDAFDHMIALLIDDAKKDIANRLDWKEQLKLKWNK